MNIKHSFMLASFSLLFFACEKTELLPEAAVVQDSRMTLAEMAQSPDYAQSRSFLTQTAVTDLRAVWTAQHDVQAAQRESTARVKIKVKFKWHGVPADDCKKSKGICVIINFRSTDPSSDIVELDALASGSTLSVDFPANVASDFGLTADGFLPIANHLAIPNDVLTDLGITNVNTEVAAGIYAANWDAAQGRYTGVTLNLRTW
jgi:hypothetical protein